MLESRYACGMLSSLLLVAVLAQGEPPPGTEQKPATPAKEAPAVEAKVFTDLEAAQAIAAWKRVPAKASLADRVAALDGLVCGKHASLVPVLDKIVRSQDPIVVRKKAAQALAWQPDKKTYETVTDLLNDANIGRMPELLEPLIKALARVGYQSKNWARLDAIFRAGFAANRISLQRAIIQLAGEHKEKQALAVLLDNFDEPTPKDPTGASNPPVEYWEARWKAWKTWREDVKAAVQRITGQKFASSEEARAWLRANGAKLGVKGF